MAPHYVPQRAARATHRALQCVERRRDGGFDRKAALARCRGELELEIQAVPRSTRVVWMERVVLASLRSVKMRFEREQSRSRQWANS